MERVELLLPAGNPECLRAAVNNGADAVYLGLSRFNARSSAENFSQDNILDAIAFCHDAGVKVYVTLNTLVKDRELADFLGQADLAHRSGADAVIIQDPCLIGLMAENFPGIDLHLSTQATVTNRHAIPKGVGRVILPRELALDEVADISKHCEAEVFIHGALCFSYSGQCLFSSLVAQRSGNRGQCSQPCRRMYNNSYPLSTMDLCLLPELPAIIKTGVRGLKVEGRLRNPLYVGTVARVYRKAVDSYYAGHFEYSEQDVRDLMMAFNRGFTTGFGFQNTIVDKRQPMNRGIYLGTLKRGRVRLEGLLRKGDGIGIWTKTGVKGKKMRAIVVEGEHVNAARAGDEIELDLKWASDGDPVYKTFDVELTVDLGPDIPERETKPGKGNVTLPEFPDRENPDDVRIFVRAHSKTEALEADRAGADAIYYDVHGADCDEVARSVKRARFFVSTPRILSSEGVTEAYERILDIGPEGVLVGERGLLSVLETEKYSGRVHLDYSFNVFNDLDLACYGHTPIISPELTFEEVIALKNKNFIVVVHGDVVLMNTKEPIRAPELVDEQGMHFKVRRRGEITEILNSKKLGLFNLSKQYLEYGIKYFYIDLEKDLAKHVKVYRRILSGKDFDDRRMRKGHTTGHFSRGVG